MKNNNPKATIQGIKVDKDLLLIEEYKLDTGGALISIRLDEAERKMVIRKKPGEFTKQDDDNIFNIRAYFVNFLENSHIEKRIIDGKEEYYDISDINSYDVTDEQQYVKKIIKGKNGEYERLKEEARNKLDIIVIEDGKLIEYNSREFETAEKERSINIVENLTVSINGIPQDNSKKIGNLLFKDII